MNKLITKFCIGILLGLSCVVGSRTLYSQELSTLPAFYTPKALELIFKQISNKSDVLEILGKPNFIDRSESGQVSLYYWRSLDISANDLQPGDLTGFIIVTRDNQVLHWLPILEGNEEKLPPFDKSDDTK